VLLVITESVRADALCSEPPPACTAKFLDEVAPDRVALGKLTTPTPGTFGSCVLLWTGLPADAEVKTAHSAPVLWEIARAVGYRTAYVTSQNMLFENFGAFVQNAGIDTLVTATELGGMGQEQVGAPDERATEAMLTFVRGAPADTPYFAVLHLSNTHAPYRVDPALQPFSPHSDNALGDVEAFHNHYRNSVLLQERTFATFLRALRALPSWDDTALLFVSDHGEQFRERGGLYHLHSLYDEEVRIPGFLVAGPQAVTEDMRARLRTFAGKRTYMTDVHASIVDLFGLGAERVGLPFTDARARSLFDKRGWMGDPVTRMSTSTPVWDQDNPREGFMQGEHLLSGAPGQPWTCFDIANDPTERDPLPVERCPLRMRQIAGPPPK
jgi:glucan phosphoethanolaminetransferase (alkaline phosphatase superfamily)